MLSVPAAAKTAMKAAAMIRWLKGMLMGEPSARNVKTAVGSFKRMLAPKPKTSTQVTTLIRSR